MSVPLALAAGVATLAVLLALTGGSRVRVRLRESLGLVPGVAIVCAAVLAADALPGLPPWALLGALGAAVTAALLLTALPIR